MRLLTLIGALTLAFTVGLTGFGTPIRAEDQAGTLKAELEALAVEHGFELRGLDHLGDAPQVRDPMEGRLVDRLAALLAGYNTYMIEDGRGGVRVVAILGRSERPAAAVGFDGHRRATSADVKVGTAAIGEKRVAGATVVRTARRQQSHWIDAVLTGPNGKPLPFTLRLDSGVTALVLPSGVIAELGFDGEMLEAAATSMSSGWVSTQVGLLAAVEIGGAIARDVPVHFIEQDYAPADGVLGLGALKEFDYILDDAKGELTLKPR